MYRSIAALLAAASCASLAQAQDLPSAGSTTPALTLDDAVAAAGGSAPAVDAARAGIDAARAARTVAGLRPNPTVQTQVENIGGTGVYRQFDTSQTTVSLGIPVELGGKRSARIAVANAQTDRALLAAAITQADIRLQVTQLYIEAVAAERRANNAAEQLRIAKDTANAARVRVQAGRASPIEEQRAGVAQANAEAGVERATRLADAARTNLARRIARPVSGPLNVTWLESLPAKAYGPLEPVDATGTLALAAADADLAVADAGVRLARSQRVPDLNVGPGVRHIAPGDVAFVVTFSMPVPIFNAGSAAVSQASAQRVQAEAQKRMTALDMEQAITDAQAEEANAATTARTANGPALAAAREAARIARIGYREGKFGQLDLLDAERTLADTRIAAIDALAAYQNAKARLERLTAPAPEQGN